ncbi:MAG: SH3 domain-containing protein [Geobacteraceae bacterium]
MRVVYLIVFIWLMMTLSGCGIRIVDVTSRLDNKRIIGYNVYDRCDYNHISYALIWNSTMPKNTVSLDILLNGNYTLAKGDSLEILIDGKKYSYSQLNDSAVTKETTIDPARGGLLAKRAEIIESYQSQTSYYIDKDLINAMITSSILGLRIKLTNNRSLEDIITNKKPIIEFQSVLQNTKNGSLNIAPETNSGLDKKKSEAMPVLNQSASTDKKSDPISMVVSTTKANLRDHPTQKAKIIKTLKKGVKVQLIEQEKDWFRVELDSGDVGWCHSSVLSQQN